MGSLLIIELNIHFFALFLVENLSIKLVLIVLNFPFDDLLLSPSDDQLRGEFVDIIELFGVGSHCLSHRVHEVHVRDFLFFGAKEICE